MRKQTWIATGLSLGLLLAAAPHAHAEVTLLKPADGWEFYSTGRIGAFAEYVQGNGLPEGRLLADGMTPAHVSVGEGVSLDADPSADGTRTKGPASMFKVRSGYLGNVLGFGLRRQFNDTTKLSAFISLWSVSETDSQRAYLKDIPDVREAYFKAEGPAGTLVIGRALTLFGRGATEIDYLYGHGYAVGAPQGFNIAQQPSYGHVGFGVLSNIWTAGVSYATPLAGGFQLSVGYYEPTVIDTIKYTRAKLGRPEAAATYDADFGGGNKLHIFAEGTFQKMYNDNGGSDSKSVYGAQAGARAELGPFHLGVAGFTGKGTGVNYFLAYTESINNGFTNNFRPIDGAYVQAQLAVSKFDFNLGYGITRAHQMTEDLLPDSAGVDYMKSAQGISAVVVYHFTSYLHGALDYFRADTKWWGGETQGVNSFNAGATITW